jgi:hypothetical protein
MFQNFPMHLEGYHYDIRALIIDDVKQTVPLFSASINQFKAELLEGHNYEDQMDYLRELTKPNKMEASKFLLKLRTANHMAIQLPNAPTKEPGFTAVQLHRKFLFAMPPSWQSKRISKMRT